MNNYFIVLKALFKNKFRFADNASKRKKYGFIALLGISYLAVMAMFIGMIVALGDTIADFEIFRFIVVYGILLTAALVVLIFGVINLITTLYLCKDTDFFSMLPIKSSTVFAAKVSYVYISEAVIVGAILLPLLIAFGIVCHMWVWFYVITVLAVLIFPALPLVLAAIIAIPVMYLASKLKNRSVVSLIFYIILFGGLFGAYLYFLNVSTDFSDIDESYVTSIVDSLIVMLYVFYPFTALALAANGLPTYGLSAGAASAANFGIFVGSSVVLIFIALLCARFMYSQSAKANNQTDNSNVKHGKFKASGMTKALMKREFIGTLRTTQVAFQCYAVVVLPIIFAIAMGIMSRNMSALINGSGNAFYAEYYNVFFGLTGICAVSMMFGTLGNAAATTFSREGSAIATLKVLPVSAKQVVKAKVCAWLCVALPAAIISVVVFNAINFDLEMFLLSIFSLIPLAGAFVLFGALWDLRSPKIKWVDPIQAVKHNGHVVIGQLLCMAGGVAALIVTMLVGNLAIVSAQTLKTVVWCVIYATLAVFVVVDVVMLRNVEKCYGRIEI